MLSDRAREAREVLANFTDADAALMATELHCSAITLVANPDDSTDSLAGSYGLAAAMLSQFYYFLCMLPNHLHMRDMSAQQRLMCGICFVARSCGRASVRGTRSKA